MACPRRRSTLSRISYPALSQGAPCPGRLPAAPETIRPVPYGATVHAVARAATPATPNPNSSHQNSRSGIQISRPLQELAHCSSAGSRVIERDLITFGANRLDRLAPTGQRLASCQTSTICDTSRPIIHVAATVAAIMGRGHGHIQT